MTKIRPRQTPDQLRTPCWCPNHRKAMQQRVSNPDCADGARPRSRREQYRLIAAPLLIGGESPLLARSLASSFLGHADGPFSFAKAFEVQQCFAAFRYVLTSDLPNSHLRHSGCASVFGRLDPRHALRPRSAGKISVR